MNRAIAVIVGALALAGAASAGAADAQTSSPAPTADEIIARQVKALGGLDKIRAIQTLRFEGKLLVNGGAFQLKLVAIKKRPGMVRTDATLQGLTVVQAYDGTMGWQIQPFQGRKDPEKLAADDAKDMADDADIDGPLIDYKAKGSAVEYLGTEDVDGATAYKLRLTEKSGDQIVYFIDTDTLMTLRTVTKRHLRGREVNTVTDYGDYELVAGVYFPFESAQGPVGASDGDLAKIQIDKGEAGVALDDATFRMGGK
jgi:hypothetical protein